MTAAEANPDPQHGTATGAAPGQAATVSAVPDLPAAGAGGPAADAEVPPTTAVAAHAPAGGPSSPVYTSGGATAAPRPRTAGTQALLTNVARSTAHLRRRAARNVTDGWLRVAPAAHRLTQRTAPVTARAAQVNLVQVAAGVAATALAAVVIAVAAQVQWEVGVLTAPLWLFMGAVLLTGTVLGPLRGLLAVGLYLVLGLIGAAVSDQGVGAYLDGPWAGVLLSLPVAALVTGAISARHAWLRSPVTASWYFFGWFFVAALTGVAIVYAGGWWTLSARADVDGWALFATMAARLPFDVLQCVLVAVIAAVVHRLAPGLFRGQRRPPRRPRG